MQGRQQRRNVIDADRDVGRRTYIQKASRFCVLILFIAVKLLLPTLPNCHLFVICPHFSRSPTDSTVHQGKTMLRPIFRTTLAAALLAGTALTTNAAEVFNRIATFHVVDNLPEGADPKKATVAEIVT